jgi:hypothetical protein
MPLIIGLIKQMKKSPPVHAIAAGLVKAHEPKKISDQLPTIGVKVKRGKVRKHGDIGR